MEYKYKYLKYKEKYLHLKQLLGGNDDMCIDDTQSKFIARNRAILKHIKRYTNACKFKELPTDGVELKEFNDALPILQKLNPADRNILMEVTQKCWFDKKTQKVKLMLNAI
jgi:hypothetical protein